MIATFIKDVSKDFAGQAEVYDVNPPISECNTVVVSSISGIYATECFIFSWDKDTNSVADWAELAGSTRGVYMPNELLRSLGYEIVYAD